MDLVSDFFRQIIYHVFFETNTLFHHSIMEGIITCAIGLAGYYLVVDFPEKATTSFGFLTESEAAFVVARIEKDRHDAIAEPFKIGKYLKAAMDLKVWGFAWLFGLTTTSTYAIAYFLPIILEDGMGFKLAAAECLVSPPYVAAAILMYTESYYADKWHKRAHFIFGNGIMSIVGLVLLGYCKTPGVRYFGVFLATMANNANVPCVLTYQANNIRGQWKRALCSATLVGAGGIGGIIGSTVFRSQDEPNYRPGIICCIVAGCMILMITALMTLKLHRANKRADAGGKIIEGLPGFRYTL
jgi:predicted MFS family arabinose efflux permease